MKIKLKTISKIKKLILQADKIKFEIAGKRDKLEEIIAELKDICSSVDEGLDELNQAILSLSNAADSLSQYL